ncbi:MAG: thiamine pyrophosphate-binding protein [Pseudomonadota bacterium]
MQKTVAGLLVATLYQIGVRHIFGVTGDAMHPLAKASREQDGMQWIEVRHDEGAALAASGQAKLNGSLGVCCCTAGAGASRLIAGLNEAQKDHAPVLAISGGVPLGWRGNDYLPENIPDLLFRDVCAYTQSLDNAERAAHVIHQAIAQAYSVRGVSHLYIPSEMFEARARMQVPSLATLRQPPEIMADMADIAEAVYLIGRARNIAILAGEGCRSAIRLVLQLAQILHAPVIHSFRAKDMVAYAHPYWIGGVGLVGGAPGVEALRDADLVLMLGSDCPYGEFLPDHGRVVQVDERPQVLGRRTSVQLGIVGSVGPAIFQIIEQLPQRENRDFLRQVNRSRKKWDEMLDRKVAPTHGDEPVKPEALVRAVSNKAQADAVVVIDTGIVTLWCGNWWRQSGRQRILASFNNAAVGTSLGQANGVQILDRERQVIVAVGDDGFSMLMGEFMTSVEYRLPVKVVVFNHRERVLARLEMGTQGLPAREQSEFPGLDFAAFAVACGARGLSVKKTAELEAGLQQLLDAPGPAILDVHIDPAELPALPHAGLEQAWGLSLERVKEVLLAIGRRKLKH